MALYGLGIATSSDGITWVNRGRPSNFVNTSCYGSGLHLVLSKPNDGVVGFVFKDTNAWYSNDSPSPMSKAPLRSIAFNDTTFVAVGDNGNILRATLDWPSLAQWRNVFYGTMANQGNAADTAAPLGDGVPNSLEYALGVDPRLDGRTYLPVVEVALDPVSGAEYLDDDHHQTDDCSGH